MNENQRILKEKKRIIRDLYLRKLATGEILGPPTGYPSVDKVYLKYHNEEYIKALIPELTAYEYLKKCNEENMDNIAINSIEETLTYKELIEKIDTTASSLQKLGNEGKIIIGILPAETSHETLLIYAASKMGSAVSFFPDVINIENLCESINEYNTQDFFVYGEYFTREMEEKIYEKTSLENIIVVNPKEELTNPKTISWEDFIEKSKGYEYKEYQKNPEDLLFLAKTGGTTGQPKSVLLSDNSFNKKVHELKNSNLDYKSQDKWLRIWPLFSASAAVTGGHISLCTGMECILRKAPENPEEWINMIKEIRPDHLVLIPMLLEWLMQSDKLTPEDLKNVKTIGVGGMIIPESFEKRFYEFTKKYNLDLFLALGYGLTENGPTISFRMNEETAKIGRVGVPLVNTTVGVFEPGTFNELGYMEEGEICVKSYSKMIGYLNDPKKTNEVIKIHEKDHEKWLHTGDIGFIDNDGLLKITGRLTRFIFTYPALQKAYLDQINTIVSSVPGVIDSAVGALPYEDINGYDYPIAFVVIDEKYDQNQVIEEIINTCKKALPEFAQPANIYLKEQLPLKPSGKADVTYLENEVKNNYGLKRVKNV